MNNGQPLPNQSNHIRMKNFIKKLCSVAFATALAVSICACDKDDEPDGGSSGASSSAKVEVSSISIGSKDKAGRYSVKITVKASHLASGETVKTIGAKWGTNKSNPSNRDSRSSGTSATFLSAWHTASTYYVTPFLKTNKTSGEIVGTTKTKKAP